MISRSITAPLLAALADTPVVLLSGGRQTGKTTLVRWLAGSHHPARYLSFDDAATLAAARTDPFGFIADLDGPVVLDEVQHAPELFPAIKQAVDRERSPGRFLLTGSANVLVLPRLSESLVGRMEAITLWPLSQGEIGGAREGFVDALFSETVPHLSSSAKGADSPLDRSLRGGYPEPLSRVGARRGAWFDAYVQTILLRDVRDLANVEGLRTLPQLLKLLAHRAGGLLNFAEISRTAGVPQTTLKRYVALFEHTFLIHPLVAWARNPGKRLVKSPKLHFADAGLLARLAGWSAGGLSRDRTAAGSLLENFAVMEVRKQIGWSDRTYALSHFRTAAGREVDLVIEDETGGLVGIEIKAAASVGASDFRGLEALREAARGRFHRGVVLYTGEERLSFGERFLALPFSALWELGARSIG